MIGQSPSLGPVQAWSRCPDDSHLDPRDGRTFPDPDDPHSERRGGTDSSREPEPWRDHHLDPPSREDRFEPWE